MNHIKSVVQGVAFSIDDFIFFEIGNGNFFRNDVQICFIELIKRRKVFYKIRNSFGYGIFHAVKLTKKMAICLKYPQFKGLVDY